MTGKIIEIGDLECLEGQPDNERSGVVILIDRAQLKASRNLFGEVVEVVPESLIASLREEVEKLHGIIARNAATRLSCNEDGEILKLYVTASDIKDSMDILAGEITAGRDPKKLCP